MPTKEDILRQQQDAESQERITHEAQLLAAQKLVLCGYDPINSVEAFHKDVEAFRKEQGDFPVLVQALNNSRKQFETEVATTREELEQSKNDADNKLAAADAYYKGKISEADKYYSGKQAECDALEQQANQRVVDFNNKCSLSCKQFDNYARDLVKLGRQKLSYHQHKIMADKWGQFIDSVNGFLRSLNVEED